MDPLMFQREVSKATALNLMPDASDDLARHMESLTEAEHRARLREKVKDSDVIDMAVEYIETTDPAIARNLIRRFWEETEKMTAIETIAAVRALPGPFFDALMVSAKDMATAEWERKHGK